MKRQAMTVVACVGAITSLAHAGYIIEIDTDGADDGAITFNSNFAFGGDTTTASSSVAAPAFGTTGGDSIFGGNGSAAPDTYQYFYTPGADADNLVIPLGTALGGGNFGLGSNGGSAGMYRVYALWPQTINVSGGDTEYTVVTDVDVLNITVDQNTNGGDEWFLIGEVNYTGGGITVTQNSQSNTFISMRSAGVLFEYVPAPGGVALLGFAGLGFVRRRTR